MPGSAQIGNLAVNLSLETAAFQRGAKVAETRVEAMRGKFASATKSISGLGAALGIGLGVGALVSVTRNAFDMAAALSESAQKMGVTVEALQRLRLAANQNGISNETLETSFSRLNRSLGDLQRGSKSAVDAFAAIGLSADDLKGKSPDQALRVIADALNKLPDVQQRVSVGSQIMGRGFSQLLPLINGGSKALDDYAEKSKKMGEISNDDAKRLDELSDTWDRLKTRTGVAAANMIATFARLAENLDGLANRWFAWRDKTIAAVGEMASRVLSSISGMVTSIKAWMVDKLNAIWDGVKAKVEAVKDAFKRMADAVALHSYVPDMVQLVGDWFGRLGQLMVDPALSATQKVGAAFQGLAGIIGKLFGTKTGSLVGALGQLVTAVAPLFAGKFSFGASGGYDAVNENLVGMASGGSGRFGGFPGVDKNVLSLNGSPIARVSRGENFRVGPDASPTAKVVIVPTPYFDAVVDNRAVKVAAPMAGQAAIMGASGGVMGMQRRAARTLP